MSDEQAVVKALIADISLQRFCIFRTKNAGKDHTKIDETGDAIIGLLRKYQEISAIAAGNVELQERIDIFTSFPEAPSTAVTEYSEAH